MTKTIALCVFIVLSWNLFTNAIELSLQDRDSIKISILPDSEGPINVTDEDKPILRYGFQRTQDCKEFEKAFICVRKCLDLDYQVAHSDKDCVCTCYKNDILAKYKSHLTGSTKWKLGAPTTKVPAWAGGGVPSKPNDYEINANYSEVIEDSDGQTTNSVDAMPGDAAIQSQVATGGATAGGGAEGTEGQPAADGGAPADGTAAADGDAAAETPAAEGAAPAEGEAPVEDPAEAPADPA